MRRQLPGPRGAWARGSRSRRGWVARRVAGVPGSGAAAAPAAQLPRLQKTSWALLLPGRSRWDPNPRRRPGGMDEASPPPFHNRQTSGMTVRALGLARKRKLRRNTPPVCPPRLLPKLQTFHSTLGPQERPNLPAILGRGH